MSQLACKLTYIYPNAFADIADYTAAVTAWRRRGTLRRPARDSRETGEQEAGVTSRQDQRIHAAG